MITLIFLTILTATALYFKAYPENRKNNQPRKANGQYANHAKSAQRVAQRLTVNDLRISCGLDRGY